MSSIVGRSLAGAALALAALLPAAAPRAASVPVQITLSLDRYAKVTHLDAGDSVGVAPPTVTVHVGDAVVFVNGDASAHHTATGLSGANRFSEPRWSDAVLKPMGAIGPNQWSTGDLAPGARSAPMVAASPGTFLYGCFFHYSAGMRGVIVVQP
jgi:plastocyanin